MIDAETVVLGVGSPLMGDDGLGVLVVDMLRERWAPQPDVALLDGGTWGMRVMPYIESADNLLLIDVIRADRPPGELIRLEHDEIPRHLHHKLSPHQIDLGEVFALAELRGNFPRRAVALGVEPERVELHHGLSATVQSKVSELIVAIEAQLVAWGCEVRRLEHAADA